ncbi:hypothetical protein RHGRI_009549 [Rhododendron griersonianum]|uniref:Non-specific serine/threonine protein kinase n=1 Tax=Rhododendron griersonianum TaxID=479676 RepID=A0AAV6KF78_9ERIC|nr:hypothetical protein RHGRI_009549 [Rhododendron griersonianum]
MEGFAIPLCILSLSIFSILITSNGVDTIATTKSLADGETIVSSGGIFELGFFSPGNSTNRYVGIWYKKILPIMTVVWVANRETPLFDKAGVLKLTSPGILVLVNGTNDIIWSTNTSRTAQDPVAQLLDSGNMVVRNSDDEMKAESWLWQSFDYPGDTLLPGMKLGKNLKTGHEWYLSSWKSDDDPAQGVFTLVLNTQGYPQIFIRNGTNDFSGSGPWNGLWFSGFPATVPGFSYYLNTEEVFYTHELTNTSVVIRSMLTHEGYIKLFVWVDQTRSWLAMGSFPKAGCDMYASCGSYGICIINNSPMCECLDKFLPKYPKDWDRFDWSRGCVRKTPLGCHEGGEDGFVKYSRVKLPDTRNSWFDTRMSLEECRRTCLKNCSCMAYANLDIREGGTGCLLWFDDLIDFKELIGGSGQDIYLRMASSESGVNVAGKDLLSFDLGTSIGADNTTMTEATKPDSNMYLWQSFDYPDDTRLPGMKLGQNLNTGLDQHLTSWRTAEDPSLGEFTYGIENHGLPQLVINKGSTKKYRSGPWNGLRFSGLPRVTNPANQPILEFNENKLISLFPPNNSFIKRSILSQSGFLQHYSLNGKSNTWELMYTAPNDLCDNYGHCGPNGFFPMKRTSCECLKGFTPKSQQEWEVLNWSNGCVRSVPLDCQKGEGFVKVAHVKLPDLLEIQLNTGMGLKECEHECLKNCSCIAYANSNISEGGSGCLMCIRLPDLPRR